MPPAASPDTSQPIAGDLVPIVLAPTPIAAHMAKSILDAAGIPCAVSGEHTGALLPHWGAALSITVLIPRTEYDRAAEAISAALAAASQRIGIPESCPACSYSLSGLTTQTRCPECGTSLNDPTRHITFAPRPSVRADPLARFGAVIGTLVLFVMFVVLLCVILWGIRR